MINKPTKGQIGWAIAVIAALAASLFFGVKFPLPTEPTGEPVAGIGVDTTGVSAAPGPNLTHTRKLTVDNAIVNNGELTQTGPVLNNLIFEGATADASETTFAITDPTADRTITFPNSSGTVLLTAVDDWVFEGTTADEFETTVTATDPTAIDKTITLPNASGTVVLSSLATNAPDAANSVTGASNALVFEGSGVDAFETSIVATNPTADQTVTLANGSGTVMLSALATNATDAANSVTGASNKLEFEGATANDYETWITPTDATADRTQTLQDASGTVALTSQAVDMTLTEDSTGGNAGAKTEYSGLPRIKLVGGGQGTNPGGQTISLVDDTPDGEYAAVDASVTLTADTSYYKYGSKSLKAVWAADAAATDGFLDAGLGGNASWEDMESVGLLVYSSATWAAGDLTLVLTDDGGARTYSIPALTTINKWVWLEVDISDLAAGTGDSIGNVAVLMSAQGEGALGAFTMYLDIAYVWDSVDEEALGTAVLQDGVLSVVNTENGASLVELTDYIVHYESGVDFIVYITDQSSADIVALVAY